MQRTSEAQGHMPYLWIIFFSFLALAALCGTIVSTSRRQSGEISSAQTPVFSPRAGYYNQDVQVTIDGPGSGAEVLFTVDGSVPTHTVGEVYTRPIRLSAVASAVTIIRARAMLRDGELGPVASASYLVGIPAKLPMMSLVVDPSDLWDEDRGIYRNPLERGREWERPVDVTYVDRDRQSGFHVSAGARVHGGWSRYFDKRSLRLYFRQEYGMSRLEYPLFAGSDVASFKRLVLHNGGEDVSVAPDGWNWTLMRNGLADSLALQMGGYATHSQPVLLFINGESWGIYQIRERIDAHFVADHYGIQSADLLDSPEYSWESSWIDQVLTGDRANWDHLMDFVEANDLTDPTDYAYVQSQVDLENYIDYTILQIYAANADWPRKNVHQFRPRVQGGRWRWMVWDSDFGFGATQHSHVTDDVMGRLMEENHPSTEGRDVLLLRSLLANPAFFQQFVSRAAELLNTTLSAPSVIAHIDSLAAELEPDIHYEVNRWSSLSSWESSVQELRDFALHRPDYVRKHFVEAFDLGGTAELAVNSPAKGGGSIAVNGTLVPLLPWRAICFQGIPMQITAVPARGHHFTGWDPPDLPQTPSFTLTLHSPQTLSPRFNEVYTGAPQPGDVVFSKRHLGDDDSAASGDWFELQVKRPGGVDLRGWRVTDNDTKTATDEGSLVFSDSPVFARVPWGTAIRIVLGQPSFVSSTGAPQADVSQDDVSVWDSEMILHAGYGYLDTSGDPGFRLGPDDNLVLLAPGPTDGFDDDQGIAFVSENAAATPASFGVLADGVR